MGLKKTAYVLLILLISGCATSGNGTGARGGRGAVNEASVQTFAEIYRKAKESGLSANVAPSLKMSVDVGQEKPYFPVYVPPKIVKVWVPAHVARGDRKILVAGHWTFVVLEEPRWYIEDRAPAEGDVALVEPAPPWKK